MSVHELASVFVRASVYVCVCDSLRGCDQCDEAQ